MSTQPPRPRVPAELQPWFEARKRFHLSHAAVQMARELGMNPKTLGKIANHRDEPWKVPLHEFIVACYYKAHKRKAPEQVRSLEQLILDRAAKKAQLRERKALRKAAAAAASHAEGADPDAGGARNPAAPEA